MSEAPARLNLRTGEKRLLVGIGIVLFVVLNVLFVWPRFGEFGRVRNRTAAVRSEIAKFEAEIAREADYQKQMREMEGQGSKIVREEQSLRLLQTVQSQALASQVRISSFQEQSRGLNTATNAFFDEQSLVVSYDAGYHELINFVVSLAEHESMIRVRQMDVKPDGGRHRLQGNITLVASYQKSRPGAATNLTSTASNK